MVTASVSMSTTEAVLDTLYGNIAASSLTRKLCRTMEDITATGIDIIITIPGTLVTGVRVPCLARDRTHLSLPLLSLIGHKHNSACQRGAPNFFGSAVSEG